MVFMPPCKSQSDRHSSFRPLSLKQLASSFNVPPPDVSTPNLSTAQPRPDSSIIQQPRLERPSSVVKLSGWLTTQGKRLSSLSHRGDSQGNVNAQLWHQNRAERGLSLWDDLSKDSEVPWKIRRRPDSYLDTDPVRPPPIEKPKLEAPRLGRGFFKSVTSQYSDLDLSSPEMVDRKSWKADSPVFGLNGIVRPSAGESGLRSQGSVTIADPNRSSNISDLFRKQEELDNSIAVLKLLESSTGSRNSGLPNSPSSSKRSGEPSATRSDFSLSNFPDPPWAGSPVSDDFGEPWQNPTPVRITQPSRFNPPSVSIDNVPFDLIPPRMPASMMEHNRTLSLPVSETAEPELVVSARTPRFDSQATQYDVTSFIGSTFLRSSAPPFAYALIDLTGAPSTDPPLFGHKKDFSGSSNATGVTAASLGSDNPESVATIVTLQQAKQTHVGSPLARLPVISSTTPGILPATRIMLPTRPKFDISRPQPAVPQLRQDVNPDTFERPRAVPFMNP